MNDVAYESILVERTDLAGYVTSLKAIDILRAQAKHHGYFKRADPSIGDHGLWTGPGTILMAAKTAYSLEKGKSCWKKAATQYLCWTLIKDGGSFYRFIVLSVMPLKTSVSEDDVFPQIQKYTTHFDVLSRASMRKCSP